MPTYAVVNFGTSVGHVTDISNIKPEDIIGFGYSGPDKVIFHQEIPHESINKKKDSNGSPKKP